MLILSRHGGELGMVSKQTREKRLAEKLDYFQALHQDVEKAFQSYNEDEKPLSWFIKNLNRDELEKSIRYSVELLLKQGESRRNLEYLFYWMIREGGQRLDGELKAFAEKHGTPSVHAFPKFVADFYLRERERYRSFDWNSIEGTCRERIKRGLDATGGVDFEVLLRTAVSEALDAIIRESVELPVEKVNVHSKARKLRGFLGEMTYDVVVDITFKDGTKTRVVLPCKGRGTTGGGHAAIFTRDVVASSLNIKIPSPVGEKPTPLFVIPIVVAQQWGETERKFLETWFCDALIFCPANLREIVEVGDLPVSVKNDLKSILKDILTGSKEAFYLTLQRATISKGQVNSQK